MISPVSILFMMSASRLLEQLRLLRGEVQQQGGQEGQIEAGGAIADNPLAAAAAIVTHRRRRSSNDAGGTANNASRVKRALFGRGNQQENLRFVQEQLARSRQESEQRWNFDFTNDRPKEGRYEWETMMPPPSIIRRSRGRPEESPLSDVVGGEGEKSPKEKSGGKNEDDLQDQSEPSSKQRDCDSPTLLPPSSSASDATTETKTTSVTGRQLATAPSVASSSTSSQRARITGWFVKDPAFYVFPTLSTMGSFQIISQFARDLVQRSRLRRGNPRAPLRV